MNTLTATMAPVVLSRQGLVTYLHGLFGPLFLGTVGIVAIFFLFTREITRFVQFMVLTVGIAVVFYTPSIAQTIVTGTANAFGVHRPQAGKNELVINGFYHLRDFLADREMAVTGAEAAGDVMPAVVSKSCEIQTARSEPPDACQTYCFARLLREHAPCDVMVASTVQTPRSGAGNVPSPQTRPLKSRVTIWWSLVMSAYFLGTEGAAEYFHSSIALTLFAVEIAILLISALTVAIVIFVVVLRGTDATRKQLFRLLRWASNRPEPSAPPDPPAEPEAPAVTADAGGDTKIGIPTVRETNGQPQAPTRVRAALPVLTEPLPAGVITLRQWAQRIDRAPSTIITHWHSRPGFPSPIGRLPIHRRDGGGAGVSLYSETQLDDWRMTQAGLQQSKRRSLDQP